MLKGCGAFYTAEYFFPIGGLEVAFDEGDEELFVGVIIDGAIELRLQWKAGCGGWLVIGGAGWYGGGRVSISSVLELTDPYVYSLDHEWLLSFFRMV